MIIVQYRVAKIKFDNKDEIVTYLCPDISIAYFDYVRVEDREDKGYVEEIAYLDEEEITTPLKMVLGHYEADASTVSYNHEIEIKAQIKKEFAYGDYHTDCLCKIRDNTDRTDFSLLQEIKIINQSNRDLNDLKLEVSFDFAAYSLSDIFIKAIEQSQEVSLKIPFLHVDKKILDTVDMSFTTAITMTLKDKEDNILARVEYLFNTLPVSQPSLTARQDYRLYAKYVTPLDPSVKEITIDAAGLLGRSILTYQNDTYNQMVEEIDAIYKALHNFGIAYQNPPSSGLYSSLDGDGNASYSQRIRMPYEVLMTKKGTCLDVSILMCACLYEVGFNPILIFVSGHAFVGVFLNEGDRFPKGVSENCAEVYNSSTDGVNRILLINAVSLTVEGSYSLSQAIEQGQDYLKGYNGFFCAIDIDTCHSSVFQPIPTGNMDDDLELLIKPKELNPDDLDVVSKNYLDVRGLQEKDRFTFWEKKLLDLTEANPLVNFRKRSTNHIDLMSKAKIPDLIQNKDAIKFEFIPDDGNNKLVLDVPSDGFIATGMEATLKQLKKKSESAMDETGSPTLYLCMGELMYERKKDKLTGKAPFMVLPIKLKKDKMASSWTMSYDYDDLMLNQTFFEYYMLEHPSTDYSALYNVSNQYQYMDYVHTFKEFNKENIQLDENVFYFANLTFSHYIMWMDVRKRKSELKQNRIIQSIIENKNLLNEDVISEEVSADSLENYLDFAAPLPYDSTQFKAILDCAMGKSFILDGPPGTGKSQTIVNMIINAFYHGKTVLFVAEKKAALDVVYDRLEKICLGRFCLELHSNKANKADFFQKLKSSMELGATKKPEEFDEKCRMIAEKKKGLIERINKVHQRKYYLSLYDAIVLKESLDDLASSLHLDDDFITSFDDEKNKEINLLIDKYVMMANTITDFSSNPLKYLKLESINFHDKEIFAKTFLGILDKFNAFYEDFYILIRQMGFYIKPSLKSIDLLVELLDLDLNNDVYIDNLANFMNSDDAGARQIFSYSKQYLSSKKELEKSYDIARFKGIDGHRAYTEIRIAKGFFNKLKVHSKYKKLIKSIMKDGVKYNSKKLADYYTIIANFNDLEDLLIKKSKDISKLLGFDYFANIEDVENIELAYTNTKKYLELLLRLADYGKYSDCLNTLVKGYHNPAYKMSYQLMKQKYYDYQDSLKEASRYQIDYELLSLQSIEEFINLLEHAANPNNFNDCINLASLNQIATGLRKLRLNDFLNQITIGRLDASNLSSSFNKALAEGIIRQYFKDDEVNYFVPAIFEAEIEKYKGLIDEYSSLVIEEVSAKLTKELNHSAINYANSSPIGRLKKTIFNNGRGTTIRDTLITYDEIIKKYFPVFLMSPLSAAQYLAVEEGKSVSKFDIVIFDEASQIPTHEAIGPIARGKSLVVAGDPEQMPPSAYFTAGLELEGEDIQYEDAVSLLDECLAIEIPRHRLSYHYRSKHESLINFSNHYFYNDNLYTFPSPNTTNSMIEFRYIELAENKKNTDISSEELRAIIDTFKEIYSNLQTMKKSVGIIVFNMNQQDVVYDSIVDLLAKDKNLSDIVEAAGSKEPWFVKSLENVQGDERDIIILSIGFRKNAQGYPTINGPLARENGQRRLNVAISRSKEKMYVLSTIRYSDFPAVINSKGKGAPFLKEFLLYADSSYRAKSNQVENKASIIHYIKDDLENLGYTVVANVGNSDFRVDLAIVDKDQEHYSLGVLVDSKEISNNISCRDKLYVQSHVLNSLKWKIINVYTLQYYKDPKGTIDQIVQAINKPFIKDDNEIIPNIEKEEVVVCGYQKTIYEPIKNAPMINYDNEYGFDHNLPELLQLIIQIEGPVSYETIKDRIREFSSLQNISQKAKSRLDSALLHFRDFTDDQTQKFYWPSSNRKVGTFRVGNRDLYDIPREEIACCMKQIIDIQQSLEKEDLFKLTLSAFEYGSGVLNNKNLERLEYVYAWAKRQKLL